VAAVVLQLVVIVVGDVGFAMLQPEPAVAEAIAGDPGSPIAVAHEIARRNGNTPGRAVVVRLFPVLPALLMVLVDVRRRAMTAGLAFGVALHAVNGVMFARSPAMRHVLPGGADAVVAMGLTALAAGIAAWLAMRFEDRVADRLPLAAAPGVPVTRGA